MIHYSSHFKIANRFAAVDVDIVPMATNKSMYVKHRIIKIIQVHCETVAVQRTSAMVLQCGPGHICVHTAKRMWPHASQTTSECGLSDQISGHIWVRPLLNLMLTTCDWITQDGC